MPVSQSQWIAPAQNTGRISEPPNWRGLLYLTICCALIYPFLFGITRAAGGQSLFVVRIIVAVECTAVGFAVAYLLRDFVRRFMERCGDQGWT
jgi:hypothetical protein